MASTFEESDMSVEKKTRKPVKSKVDKTLESIPEKVEAMIPEKEISKTLESIPEKLTKTKLVVELDDSEYRLIETYTKLWNDRHADIEAYEPITPALFLLYATLKWVEYEERGGADGIVGDELGVEEDASPEDQLGKADFTDPDPLDDDPDFVEAFIGKVGGVK